MPLESVAFVKESLKLPSGRAEIYNVSRLAELGYDIDRLPFSLRILLENAARHAGEVQGALEASHAIARWPASIGSETPFMPHRVLLQDYTGVPLVVDLASMREAAKGAGMDTGAINSRVPVDLVVDHSVQVDAWGNDRALATNLEKEYERNSERYSLLKWAQSSFKNMRVIPPGKGICHQVNLEYLSRVIATSRAAGRLQAFPDTLVGTDSHTTMVNGLGCLGWGVGGIEAEAVMLGEPYHMPIPKVFGVKLTGSLGEGVTPTDLVLTVTERLREKNVVGAFVEYFGEGYAQLSVPDRATLGNMSPEYGATTGFFPVDGATLSYLEGTSRPKALIRLVERYTKRLGIFVADVEPSYSEVVHIELDKIEPSIAGPHNPEERRPLRSVPSFAGTILAEKRSSAASGVRQMVAQVPPSHSSLSDGSVVIAAITSCTNTSNPTVMVGAGLIAKKAVEAGLRVKPWVKPSLAPGSTVVTDYLKNSGLFRYLDKLGFVLVGYGCTTCIGNSGPLSPEIEKAIKERDLYSVAVLSGNRNFDGRIHPLVKGAFLMSPMLVVSYALAGRIDFDFGSTPLGTSAAGSQVFLKDLWPTLGEIKRAVQRSLSPGLYARRYAHATEGGEKWEKLASFKDDVYHWEGGSTYIRNPPWFEPSMLESAKKDIIGARALAYFEDKVTTDHISPAGTIAVDSPAGVYLRDRGVDMIHFSTYGSRRGNHEVMERGGFANIRLRNLLAKGKEGGYTSHLPDGALMTIFDAATKYLSEETPLVILAGKRYGSGSSRDWAAKAPRLLGVRAVIAESFERIHRSNLVAMGVVPLEFPEGEGARQLGLDGDEAFDVLGLGSMDSPKGTVEVVARGSRGERRFKALVRVDNETEMGYLQAGGVLPYVFSKMDKSGHQRKRFIRHGTGRHHAQRATRLRRRGVR